jgi:hypothetical protein
MFLKQPNGGAEHRKSLRGKQQVPRSELDGILRPANKTVFGGGRGLAPLRLAKSIDYTMTTTRADAEAATLGPKF